MSAGAYIKQLELGPMQNFVYLIGDPETRECVVVDPAWEIDAILAEAAADDMRIRDVLITHTHRIMSAATSSATTSPGWRSSSRKIPPRCTCTRRSASSSGASARTS